MTDARKRALDIFDMPKDKKYAAYEVLIKETVSSQDAKGVEDLVRHCKLAFPSPNNCMVAT